jgi:hypothetical protein
MDKEKFESIYHTMCGLVWQEYAEQGVEDIFCDGSVCSSAYEEISYACERLRKRLHVKDEDRDIDTILYNYEKINREIARKMLEYGIKYTKEGN